MKKRTNHSQKRSFRNLSRVKGLTQMITLPPSLLKQFADTVAKGVVERLPLKKRLRPKIAKKEKLFNPLLIDTSALIDGRIVEIAQTGFLAGTLLVPHFILKELQNIADSPDSLKRSRGRQGLGALENLRKNKDLKLKLMKEEPEGKSVDEKLITLARSYRAKIITCDFNLNKVAKVFGLRVLNVNELAQKIKAIVLPGEEMTLKLVQPGKEKNQGVGYLPDGTMIVVEEGGKMVGQEVTVTVSRILQTVAGRMIFAKRK